jgi:hypothetical protein
MRRYFGSNPDTFTTSMANVRFGSLADMVTTPRDAREHVSLEGSPRAVSLDFSRDSVLSERCHP